MGKDLQGKELGTGLSQRSNGTYQARYVDRWGKRKYLYGTDLSKLRERLIQAQATNINRTSVKDNNLTLDEWYERWLKVYKEPVVRPNTLLNYTNVYTKNIRDVLGRRSLSDISKSDVQLLINTLEKQGYGYERQNEVRILLNDLLARACEDDYLVKNPVRGVRILHDKPNERLVLTEEQQRTFFTFSVYSLYDNLFHVAINTGLRVGELCALTPNDIHLDEAYIDVNKTLVYQKYLTDSHKTFHIEPPKTKQSARRVPINDECRKYLVKQLSLKDVIRHKNPKIIDTEEIFVTQYNTRLNAQIVSDAIYDVVKHINMQRDFDNEFPMFTCHTFRHTFATNCLKNKVNPKIVQKILGHATLQMTMDLYTHVTDDMLNGVLNGVSMV